MMKKYKDLIQLETFDERLEYLKTAQKVGDITFGGNRWVNQRFYKSEEWLCAKEQAIFRDNGCDLGMIDRPIQDGEIITVHHIEPITIDDILSLNEKAIGLDNLITTKESTHKRIHYEPLLKNKTLENNHEQNLLQATKQPIIRSQYDTCPWKKGDE